MTERADAATRLSALRALPDEELGRRLPAQRVLRARVREQLEALLEAELATRAGRETGVHDARVGCRRLVVAVATFRPLVEPAVRAPLTGELKWFARSLGAARDHDVTRERVLHLARLHLGEGPDLVGLIDQLDLREGSGVAGQRPATEALDSDRYAELLDTITALLTEPLRSRASGPDAGPFLRRQVRREWRRLVAHVSVVTDAPGPASDEQLHDARKAAKRMRYALETAELLWLRKPRALRRHVHRLTDLLGEHQDTVITRAELRNLAAQAEREGVPTRAHHRLHEIETRRAAELEAEFRRTWTTAADAGRDWP